MSAAKQVIALQQQLSAAEQVINELVKELHELQGTLSRVYEQQTKPVQYQQLRS